MKNKFLDCVTYEKKITSSRFDILNILISKCVLFGWFKGETDLLMKYPSDLSLIKQRDTPSIYHSDNFGFVEEIFHKSLTFHCDVMPPPDFVIKISFLEMKRQKCEMENISRIARNIAN